MTGDHFHCVSAAGFPATMSKPQLRRNRSAASLSTFVKSVRRSSDSSAREAFAPRSSGLGSLWGALRERACFGGLGVFVFFEAFAVFELFGEAFPGDAMCCSGYAQRDGAGFSRDGRRARREGGEEVWGLDGCT